MAALSAYHQKFLTRSNEEMERRAVVKEDELNRVLEATKFKPTSSPVKIAVLGCPDKRMTAHYQKSFEKLFGSVTLSIFDITTEQLAGEPNVIQHDCSLPLPNSPYDITFAHVLLKFIETEKQWAVLKNSYDVLRQPGLAIHIFDKEDVTTTTAKQKDGYYSVPLEKWKNKLDENKIKYLDLRWEITMDKQSILLRGL